MDTVAHVKSFDASAFRQVLGHFPTGVAAVTAVDGAGDPVGMVVGSFTSVSLDPPLVAFLPDKNSSSFPPIRDAGRFCVNVLSARQENVCRKLAAKGSEKFAGLSWSGSPEGSPIIDGAVAWIDCNLVDVIDAGDHFIALGEVMHLEAANAGLPLLFFQGGYGSFTPRTLMASHELDLVGQLRWAGLARGEMESLARDLDVDCLAAALAGDEIVVVASAGRPTSGLSPTGVGQRVPFVAPFGGLWLAWGGEDRLEGWIPPDAGLSGQSMKERYMEAVDRVRERGWSLGLGDAAHTEVESMLVSAGAPDASPDLKAGVLALTDQLASSYEPATILPDKLYDVRNISAPVFNGNAEVVLTLTLCGFGHCLQAHEIDRYKDRLMEAAARVGESVGSG